MERGLSGMGAERQPIARQVSKDAGAVHVDLDHVSMIIGKKSEARVGLADDICLLWSYLCGCRAVFE